MNSWIRIAVAALFMAGPAAAQTAGTDIPETTRWVVTEDGNEARYRVREQLARLDFPSDAVGATGAVSGIIVFTADGAILPGASAIRIAVDSLATDSQRRDNYVRRRTLDAATWPEVLFVPTALEGVHWPLPATGDLSFRLRGDLTVRDATRPVVWDVTATIADGIVRGEARTSFTFEEFGMQKPSVGSVLSVADDIRLEYQFTLERRD